jgi:geranylgeranyl reductase family protein
VRDVLVVGGGPTGSTVARELAQAGHDVVQVEEHDEIGQPVQCGGLLTPKLVDLLPGDVSPLYETHLSRARIFSPDGTCLHLDAGETRSIAADRAGLDRYLADLAREAGAEQRLGTKVVDATYTDDGVEAETHTERDRGQIEARVLVGADGAQSRVAKWFDLFEPKQYISLHGAQMTGLEDLDPNGVEMWLGEDRAPGFFTYIIPTGPDEGKVEAGVWHAPRPTKHYYERMFEDPLSAPHLEEAEETYTISATIPFGPADETVRDRVALVGDAAGQAKPTTGGGIYTGIVCAEILAEELDAALREDELGAKRLQTYHERWTSTIGRELQLGMRMRHAFLQLDDADVDDIWRRLTKDEVTAILNEHGDIDYPSKLAFRLLKAEPGLIRHAPSVLKGFLQDLSLDHVPDA